MVPILYYFLWNIVEWKWISLNKTEFLINNYTQNNVIDNKLIFFQTKDTVILLFPLSCYQIKLDMIWYYFLNKKKTLQNQTLQNQN